MKLTDSKSRPIVNFPAYYLGRRNSMYSDRYTTVRHHYSPEALIERLSRPVAAPDS